MLENTEKPISEFYRPELTRLPKITWLRKVFRWLLKDVVWIISHVLLKIRLQGGEYLPTKGPVLMVSNHLGDADGIVGLALSKAPFDLMGKVELYDIPILGRIMEWYGTIWVHRGRPDRRALRAVLHGLAEGRMIAIAPEGQESTSGALEQGTGGAAYIAIKANVPVLPAAITGTENVRIYRNLKIRKRTHVTFKIGEPFYLQQTGELRSDIEKGTQTIMRAIAQMLPPEYQGVYRDAMEEENDDRQHGKTTSEYERL
jgi:1-acyl-sn-glycerol-3-phosphate acyltransferase